MLPFLYPASPRWMQLRIYRLDCMHSEIFVPFIAAGKIVWLIATIPEGSFSETSEECIRRNIECCAITGQSNQAERGFRKA
jgi:hypothetical protein